ncbi:MAG: class I SAM-dependent methyltransferase, partial [Gemmatimonadetes bacterium]|nr:class I SAM-dependent methyltransferase [Gemmatimonadota bacterium]
MQRTSLRKARLYDQYRLPYAADAVVALLERIGPVNSVADIGAGTGQLTRLFAPHCRQVIAIEPDPAMRTVAGESLAGLTSAHIVAGSAEQTSLASASIELLVIGNAFHRFPAGACDELRRVLAPQGHVALFHYVLPTPLTDMLFSKLATLEGLSSRTRTAWPRLPLSALFG